MNVKIDDNHNNSLTASNLAWQLQKLGILLRDIDDISEDDIEKAIKKELTIYDRVRLLDVLDYLVTGDGSDLLEVINDLKD